MPLSKTMLVSILLVAGALIARAQPALNPKLVNEKRIKVVSPHNGIIAVVGTEMPQDKIPLERKLTIRFEKETRTFKKLKAGDRVEAEQVVARLNDDLALADLERARSALRAAELELETSIKTAAEAELRFNIVMKLRACLSVEELREKMLSAQIFRIEVGVKKELVKQAKLDIRRAEIIVGMHVIRSPVCGIIRVIHWSRGEGVKAFEPILELVPDPY